MASAYTDLGNQGRIVRIRGALVFDGRELHEISAAAAVAVDTNGAGDMFAGAFLYALTQGFDHPRAGHFANQAAAVASRYGPRLPAADHLPLVKRLGVAG